MMQGHLVIPRPGRKVARPDSRDVGRGHPWILTCAPTRATAMTKGTPAAHAISKSDFKSVATAPAARDPSIRDRSNEGGRRQIALAPDRRTEGPGPAPDCRPAARGA